jgi:Response regulator containing a CheY-like receiver domain and an HTH DNA-binding domain
MKQLRVLLADDHAMVREGTRSILAADPTISIVGEAADGAEAVDMARELTPDVVLLDMAMPVMNGVEATRRLRSLEPPPYVLLLSAYDEVDYVQAALAAGANGYLLKTAHAADVVAAIHSVAQGEVVLHPGVARKLLSHRARDDGHLLSQRETEVLHYLARGARNREIATALQVSTRTVEGHLTSVFNKLGVSSRTEAIVRASSLGLLESQQAPMTRE